MNMPSTLAKYDATLDDRVRSSSSAATSLLSIGDMARAYGVSLRTLRFYEGRGLLNPKRDGSARYYGAEDRRRLQLILKGKQLGFTLAEIRDMIAKDRSGDNQNLALNRDQIALQITHLERQRKALDDAIDELSSTLERLRDG